MTTAVVMESSTIEDTGEYKVHAKNPAGEDSCVVKVTVQGKYFHSCIQQGHVSFVWVLRFHGHLIQEVIVFGFTEKKEKPKFLKKPTDKEVKETEDVVFETQVSAKPEPTVEWYVHATW